MKRLNGCIVKSVHMPSPVDLKRSCWNLVSGNRQKLPHLWAQSYNIIAGQGTQRHLF